MVFFASLPALYAARGLPMDMVRGMPGRLIASGSSDAVYLYSEVVGTWLRQLREGAIWPIKLAEQNWQQHLLARWPEKPPFSAIVPVPSYNPRANSWGRMIRSIGEIWQIPVLDVLGKLPHEQHRLSMQARKKAANFIYLKPVYSQNQKQLPHSVLLLDDVRTSGTTLAQAEQVLFENGVKKIEKTIFATVRQKL